jgi:hypothetical protein
MAFMFQGIGTTFYGQRDFRADGTYVTTEWVVVFFVPIFPRHSLRVRHLGLNGPRFQSGFASSQRYAVLEKTPPSWKQVVYVYGYIVFVFNWIVYFFGHFARLAQGMSDGTRAAILVMGAVWPLFLPFAFRSYAKRKLRA